MRNMIAATPLPICAVSSSPFAGFTLSTLVFDIGDGTPTIDETGNYSEQGGTYTVKAFFPAQVSSNPQAAVPGELRTQVYLKGVFVDPSRLPAELRAGSRARATINGVEGTFTLALSVRDGYGISDQLGDPIEGTFSQTSNRGNLR